MQLKLLPINAGRFKKSLVLRQATRASEEYIWPVLEAVGRERVDWLIKNNKPLAWRIFTLRPDWIGGLKRSASSYKWAVDLITDEDVRKMLPGWFTELASENGEVGEQWLGKELGYLRSFFN